MNQQAPLPRVILFDLDDTILRFTAGQPDAWRISLEEHFCEPGGICDMLRSIRKVSEEFWADSTRAFWGRQHMLQARRRIAEQALHGHGVEPALAHAIGEKMTRTKEALVRPFEGAIGMLDTLLQRGHRLGLLTNGSSEFQRNKLRRYALEGHFELISIEGELGYGKPDPRVFFGALKHFRCRRDETVMIGDNLVADIRGAASVGIPGIWHDCYQTGLPERCPAVPIRIVRDITELVEPPAG